MLTGYGHVGFRLMVFLYETPSINEVADNSRQYLHTCISHTTFQTDNHGDLQKYLEIYEPDAHYMKTVRINE